MATYKVLQDIEAEDTLIGPLTLRQCIYAAIAVVAMYLCFVVVMKGAAFMVIFLLPFVGFGLFFAFPWSKQQSTEVWALAKVRFYLKPRKRIWNQSGVHEMVTITAPKYAKRPSTSNLTPNEVKSRLKALADTIDSRGWAVKNVDLGYYTKPSLNMRDNSDRLLSMANMPLEVPNLDGAGTSDIFDVQNNPVAQKFDVMMNQAAGAHREQIMQQMAQQQNPAPTIPGVAGQVQPADYWHLKNVAPAVSFKSPMPGPTAVPTEASYQQAAPLVQQPAPLIAQPVTTPLPAATQHVQESPVAVHDVADESTDLQLPVDGTVAPGTISSPVPAGVVASAAAPQPQPMPSDSAMTGPANPAILELANNNDLNVATIAREAQARNPDNPDEVVVSLH